MCPVDRASSVMVSRKTRSRTRKPKFLSLNLELEPENSLTSGGDNENQLTLFPLHPENLIDENVAYFLDSDSGNTLDGVLDAAVSSEQVCRREDGEVYGGAMSLVRSAMRGKARDVGEEKWVSYSEVVEKKEEEVSSNSEKMGVSQSESQLQCRRLSLKLDYQEILDAWSDKRSLFIKGESLQSVVPDVDFLAHDCVDGWGNAENIWKVPEFGSNREAMKTGQREASVLRYKEKRQNRLFAKRIRYEVRKLNAEKRPRMKGRFVKRD